MAESVDAGAIAFMGTALVSLLTAYSDKFTAILKQAVERRGERDARWVVGQVGGVGFGDRYRQSLIYTYRATRTQGFDLAPFKPDLEQVYVPLRVQASSLPQLSPALIQPERSIDALSIWPFLVNAPTARIALIGPPGSGKSTLLEHLALTYARKLHRQQHPKAPDRVPVLLYLRDWRDAIAADSPPSLVELIEQQVQRQPSDRPLENAADWFATRLAQSDCLVMLDGLDEVADPTQRQKVAQMGESADAAVRAIAVHPYLASVWLRQRENPSAANRFGAGRSAVSLA
ncbi:MAG: NACHT domain-containing protein [Leptolyngbyaceae cyanobacterium SM1_3_5]|nr:NACHT domain-containing protein [Leptolyngbyaceae cyanobacterium SM1_3_5]